MLSILNAINKEIKNKESTAEIFSKEFIFNSKFAEIRNWNSGSNETSTKRRLLSFLLHEELNEENRKKIFPERFDLGSHSSIPLNECTYKSLAAEIGELASSEDAFDSIKDGIKRITGYSSKDYINNNKEITLKTIKTLFLISRKRKSNIFSLLAAPELRKSGLEIRLSHPNKKTSDLVFLLADLREYLGAELSTKKIVDINNIFNTLEANLFNFEEDVLTSLFHYNKEYKAIVENYKIIQKKIENYEICASPQKINRLDETLYTYISSLEIRNFIATFPALTIAAENTIRLSPAIQHMKRMGLEKYQFDINALDTEIKKYTQAIADLLGVAFQEKINTEKIEKYTISATKLLIISRLFSGKLLVKTQIRFSLIIAAYCVIHAEYLKPTKHMPYWFGQQAVGDSLLTSLNQPLSERFAYEEHTKILQIRLYYFENQLNNQIELYETKKCLNTALLTKAQAIACIQNSQEIFNQSLKFFNMISISLTNMGHRDKFDTLSKTIADYGYIYN